MVRFISLILSSLPHNNKEGINIKVYSDIFTPYLLSQDVPGAFVTAFDPLYRILF